MRRRTDAGRATLQVTAERVRRSIRRRLLFANVAGAIAVLTFVQLASGKSLAPEVPQWLQVLGPIAPAVVLILPGYLWGHRAFTRAIAWALEGRSPTLAERFAVLREPWRQALRPLLVWVIAAFFYAGITALFGASFITVARVVEGTLLGGVTTCALAYLLIERSFRPLFAHVLDRVPDRRPRTPGIRLRLLLTWAVGSGVPLLALALVLFLDGNEIPPNALAMLSLVGLAAGFIATVASARSLAEPLDGLRHALARVRDDDLDVGLVPSTTAARSARLQAGVNRMVDGPARAAAAPGPVRPPRRARRSPRRRSSGAPGCDGEERATPARCSSTSWARPPWPRYCHPTRWSSTLNDFFDVPWSRAVDAPRAAGSTSSRATARCACSVRRRTQPDHAGRASAGRPPPARRPDRR